MCGLENPLDETHRLCKNLNQGVRYLLQQLLSFFSTNLLCDPPEGMSEQKNSFTLSRTDFKRMVREVGFEPTNPYGTGASGLRVQDPTFSTGLFDLAWQHEPPHEQGGLPQTPGPLPQEHPSKTRP